MSMPCPVSGSFTMSDYPPMRFDQKTGLFVKPGTQSSQDPRPSAVRIGLRHLRQKLSISSRGEVSSQPANATNAPWLAYSNNIPHTTTLAPASSRLYEGVPLKHADSIRVLTIHAGQRQDVLRCSLTATRLNLRARASYSAVSYMWGSRDQVQSVIVNDEVLYIHLNLYQFLLRLRHVYGDIVVWADAICINQNDPHEKGRQVQLMSRIYSQANKTLVWLGESMPDLGSLIFDYYGSGLDENEMIVDGRAEKALVTLIDHEYWTRTWILQEVILAKDVLVYVGRQDIEWTALLDMFSEVAKIYAGIAGRIYTASKLERMLKESRLMLMHEQRSLDQGQQRKFSDLIRDHKHSKCQSRHDRVFGIVGLITDPDDPLYPISLSQEAQDIFDYTLPLEELRDKVKKLYGYQDNNYWGDLQDALIW